MTFLGKEITLGKPLPGVHAGAGSDQRRELEQQLYEVFRKYADKRQKEEAGA